MIANCVVCDTEVYVTGKQRETHIDPAKLAQGELTKSIIIVCKRKRCRKLLKKTLADAGMRQVGEG